MKAPSNPPRRRIRVQAIQAFLGGRPIAVEGDARDAVRPGLLRSLFHMLHLLSVGLRRSQLTRMAAALSYRTIFGLIPVLVVVAVALAAFTEEKTQQTVIKQMLTYAGLSDIRVESGEHTPPPPPAAQPAETPGAPSAATLDEWVNSLATRAAKHIKSLPFNVIGAVALLTLIYAAFSMLVEIEQAFNQIYNAPEGRSWFRRVIQYWTLLTFGPILLVASFAITQYAQASAEHLDVLSTGGSHEAFRRLAAFVIAVVVSTVFLWIIYATVPNTRVQAVPAFLGALIAGVLWEGGKLGFTAYVGQSSSYKDLYGAVAVLPLFLLWVYLSWLVVLFGLQLAYSMQTYRQATARGLTLSVLATLGLIEDPHPAGRPRLVDPASILTVLACVAERFALGKSSDHAQVAQATAIDEQAVGEMLEKLAAAGILHRVVNADRLNAYTLSRPAEAIPAESVLRLAEELMSPRGEPGPRGLAAAALRDARERALTGRTLADFLPPPPTAPDAAPGPAPATLPA